MSLLLFSLSFGLSLWLGLYLLARNSDRPLLNGAGAGLVAYALLLALSYQATLSLANLVALLPPLLWAAAARDLLPAHHPARRWLVAMLGGAGVLSLILISAGAFRPGAGALRLLLSAVSLAPLAVAIVLLLLVPAPDGRADRLRSPILVVLIFFALAAGFYLLPLDLLTQPVALLLMGLDLALLGLLIAAFDAFEEGQTLLPDLLASFSAAVALSLLFGGQIMLAIFLGVGLTPTMVALLTGVLAAAIAIAVFAGELQGWLDTLLLGRVEGRQASELRQAAAASRRADPAADLQRLPFDEFHRLTRRALGHMGSMPRLAASPLAHLPLLSLEGEPTSLDRGRALRALLVDAIDRLRPEENNGFSAGDEWRHYNALYYLYVAGLKPYSRRATHEELNAEEEAALDWFRREVPQRTLYNWQTAAARLIARDLREQLEAAGP
ncbi:MAG: hypothetical protein R3272_05915 [Candidatus Promineifilaceae bacterium]|nr:hypothetical protein [Candidatus Promineifilaceae bacterium]